jgi:hydrogenase maturation factor
MHDPTEGGLATGLWEMAKASGQGIEVDLERISLLSETAAFCQALDLDPLGLIASGALLAAASPEDTPTLVRGLTEAGVQASVIGRVVGGPPEVRARTAGGLVPLAVFARDELARVLEESSQGV